MFDEEFADTGAEPTPSSGKVKSAREKQRPRRGSTSSSAEALGVEKLLIRVRTKYPDLNWTPPAPFNPEERHISDARAAVRLFHWNGYYIKRRRSDENFRIYWQSPGSDDLDHFSLDTKDLQKASDLVVAFVNYLAHDASGRAGDPEVVSVIRRYLDSEKGQRTTEGKRSHLKRYIKLINDNLNGVKMSEFTSGMQKDLIRSMAAFWAPHTVRTCMTAFSAAVTYACQEDDTGTVFCKVRRPPIVLNLKAICNLLKADLPKELDWHPELDEMALVLKELSRNEGVRRWAFLALFTALRPGHIRELNSRMLDNKVGGRVLDTRRSRDTAADQYNHQDELFQLMSDDVKRRPVLPLPDLFYGELASWGEGLWVNVSASTIDNYISQAASKLNLPELMPSSFRDFCMTFIRNAHVFFEVPMVDVVESEIWFGHRVASKVHSGYGRYDRGYLKGTSVAVLTYMKWLDEASGGTLFRGVSAGSGVEGAEFGSGDIRAVRIICEQPMTAAAIRSEKLKQLKNLSEQKVLADEQTGFDEASEPGETAADDNFVPAPERTVPSVPSIPIREEWQAVSRGELAGLTGAKVLKTGQIEGFQGTFRRVSDGREPGIWADEFKRVGSKYVLPTLESWFRVTGIEIYETDPTTPGSAVRVFVEWSSQTVMSTADVKSRMVASLGRDPGGWVDHSKVRKVDASGPPPGPFEYRDLDELPDLPRGLLDIVGAHSPLGAVSGVPGWFREVPSMPFEPPSSYEQLDWRHLLRNLQLFFLISITFESSRQKSPSRT